VSLIVAILTFVSPVRRAGADNRPVKMKLWLACPAALAVAAIGVSEAVGEAPAAPAREPRARRAASE